MSAKICLAGIAIAMLVATPAFAAVSVTNKDTKDHKVVVNYGNKADTMNVAAGKSIEVNCPQDCGFRDMAYGFSRIASGNDHLVIDSHAMLHFKGGRGDLTFQK